MPRRSLRAFVRFALIAFCAVILPMSSAFGQAPGVGDALKEALGGQKQDAPAQPPDGQTPAAQNGAAAGENDQANGGEQPAPPQPDPDLRSPRDTMRTFLEAMNAIPTDDQAEKRAIKTLDVSRVEDANPAVLVRQLYDIFNRIERIELEEFPSQETVEASNLKTLKYIPYGYYTFDHEDFYDRLRRQTDSPMPAAAIRMATNEIGEWRFTAKTVADIPKLYEQLLPMQPIVDSWDDWLRRNLPRELTRNEFLDVQYWQWLGILILIFIGLSLDLIVRVILGGISARMIRRAGGDPDPQIIKRSVRPYGLVAATLFWLFTLWMLDIPGTPGWALAAAVRAINAIAVAFAAWRTVDLIGEFLLARSMRTNSRIDDVLVPLVGNTLKIFIVAFGLIFVADAFNIPITPLLGMITVLGVGFSFAAKDTVENFFGSVAVLLDRPFDVGDWVLIDGDTEGIVEEVGFRSTRIRTFYNSQITMPNSNLVRARVDNFGRRRYRRWNTTLGIQYDTPPETILAFTEGIRELIRHHPYTRKDYFQVWFNGFGAHSLDVLLYLFYEVPDWSTELRERERLALDIIRLADQLGVQFAFPTQTIHLFKEEHKAYQTQHETPQTRTDRVSMIRGIRLARQLIRNQPWREQPPGPVEFRDAMPDTELDAAGNPIEHEEETPPQEQSTPEAGQTTETEASPDDTPAKNDDAPEKPRQG